MSTKPRISYVPLDDMSAEMKAEMERCVREGTPRPESSAVRAHVPACFWFFANSWNDVFRNGILDHEIKELCRLYVSRSVVCEFCGNQRSLKGQAAGVKEAQVDDLMNFWNRMHKHFTEPELVELGCAVGLTLGQQSWLRLLDIEHHQVMADLSSASMAPGYETSEELKKTKAAADYWAKKKPSAEADSA
jgi:alkylhydroperoxidase family enzyme